MKKTILFGVLFSILILSTAVFAQQNNNPLQSLINTINETINNIRNDISALFQKTGDLQHQVDTLELTPGTQGETGAQGLPGEKGEKGDKGDTGEKGEQGEPSDINIIVEHNLSDLQALIGGSSQQQSFFDVFMKIGDIKGESTDDKHKEWIDVLSYGHGMSNTGGTSFGGGAGAGKANHQDFSIVKKLDKSSPELYLHVNDGKHIQEVIIEVIRKGDKQKQKYMEYKLTDVLITSVQIAGNPNEDRPIEQISLNYAEIEWTYTPQKEDGSLDSPIKTGWNVKENIKV
ncbi:type VI secretion system tube protein Hcp [Candidatus Pacearchaeota archaeon]|nr:type VI secretion system tube protein Hcp [Candidatus Pacearchaeota archaeon]